MTYVPVITVRCDELDCSNQLITYSADYSEARDKTLFSGWTVKELYNAPTRHYCRKHST